MVNVPMANDPAAPRVTIVIPVYNRAATIGAALLSIGAGGRDDLEVIVVDDGSTDGSAEAARAAIEDGGMAGVAQVIEQENAGPGAARNTGAAQARGDYLAFFDSDDRWFPWTLDLLLEALRAHPEGELFFLQSVDFHRGAAPDTPQRTPLETRRFARFLDAIEAVWSITYASCNVIMPRRTFVDLGGFTHDVHCSEDTDLFLRADPAGPCVLVMAPAMLAREVGQPDSLTGSVRRVVEGLDFMVAKERGGHYPGGAGSEPKRLLLLAGATISTVRLCFARGYPHIAYALLLRNADILYRGQRGRVWLRLLLTPVLSVLRPKYYQFRFRPS